MMDYRYKDYLKLKEFKNLESLKSILNFVPPTSDSGLDLMCGTGIVGAYIQSEKNIEMTFADKERDVMSDISADKYISDITSMDSFENEQFDLIVCRGGLNNLSQEQWPLAVNEIKRILALNGTLIIQDHFPLDKLQLYEINLIEQQIAKAEGKDIKPWIPSFYKLESYFFGYSFVYTTFLMKINFERRMKKKNTKLIISENSCFEDEYLKYPITTIKIKKLSN